MDIKAYIESGIIERFVLGETNEKETFEVISNSKLYPEIKAEIAAVENSLIMLAEASSHQPAAETKEKLMDKLFSETTSSAIKMEVSKSPRSTFANTYLRAASIALLLSVGSNVYFFMKYNETKQELIALNDKNIEFAENLKTREASYKLIEEQYKAISSMDVIPVKLNGSKILPDAKALVYYNPASQEVYIKTQEMPSAPSEKQYQLWAIVDGKPVDAGVFDGGSSEIIKMKSSLKPSAFAVTIEKKGGSVNPTLEMMVLIGNLPG